jgi:hypothetical protein
MIPEDYEPTLTAALRLLEAGPFWWLDLWHRCSPALQCELIAALLDEPSFQIASRAARSA